MWRGGVPTYSGALPYSTLGFAWRSDSPSGLWGLHRVAWLEMPPSAVCRTHFSSHMLSACSRGHLSWPVGWLAILSAAFVCGSCHDLWAATTHNGTTCANWFLGIRVKPWSLTWSQGYMGSFQLAKQGTWDKLGNMTRVRDSWGFSHTNVLPDPVLRRRVRAWTM